MISINAKLLHNYNLRAPGEDIVENPYTDEDYMPAKVQLLGLSPDEEVEDESESNYSTASASDVDDDEQSDSNEGDDVDYD